MIALFLTWTASAGVGTVDLELVDGGTIRGSIRSYDGVQVFIAPDRVNGIVVRSAEPIGIPWSQVAGAFPVDDGRSLGDVARWRSKEVELALRTGFLYRGKLTNADWDRISILTTRINGEALPRGRPLEFPVRSIAYIERAGRRISLLRLAISAVAAGFGVYGVVRAWDNAEAVALLGSR